MKPCVIFRYLILLVFLPLTANAETVDTARAKFNYQMFCQGCHTASGEGHKSVPQLKNHMGYFLKSQKGREYLVRVPGSANAALNDQQLAELLNWMIVEFSEDSLPDSWQTYSAHEVADYRKEPLNEVINYRKNLVKELTESP